MEQSVTAACSPSSALRVQDSCSPSAAARLGEGTRTRAGRRDEQEDQDRALPVHRAPHPVPCIFRSEDVSPNGCLVPPVASPELRQGAASMLGKGAGRGLPRPAMRRVASAQRAHLRLASVDVAAVAWRRRRRRLEK